MNHEKQLLLRLCRSEEEAFRELFARYYGKVYRFIRAILHDGVAAEDLTQNVFLKIWYSRHKLLEIKSLDSFVFIMSRNEACDYIRRNKIELKFGQTTVSLEESECEIQFDYDKEVIQRTVSNTLDKMPAQRRRAYLLSREENLTHEEIAVRMNISKRTVDRHISMALDDIRKAVGPLVSGLAFFFISHWV